MTDTPVFETKRLRLRPITADDATALHPVLSDAQAMRYWSRAPTNSVAETRAYIDPARPAHGWRWWAITLKPFDFAIGWVSVGERRQGGVAEIGYILAREHWGRGIAREAVRVVIDHLFDVEEHRRVFADTDPENAGSCRLLEQLGFTLEGRLRGEWETHIGVRDSLIWGLLREEWQPGRSMSLG